MNENEKKRLFVDLDGTACVFRPVETLETLYEEGYFLNLPPQMNVVNAVRQIYETRDDVEVFVMSAVLSDSKYALNEKNAWVDKYLPEIDKSHRIFPPCGADKKEYIPDGVKETDFLLDDYTHNLTLWQPPARGIKLLNGINDTHGSWTGDKLDYRKSGEHLARNIVEVMNGRPMFDVVPRKENGMESFENKKRFALLQLNDRTILHETPSGDEYDLVYFEELPETREVRPEQMNEAFFIRFNENAPRPSNYYGTSMMRDDVLLYGDGERIEAYHCDRFGFHKLDDEFVTERLSKRFMYGLDIKKEYDMLMQGRQEELVALFGNDYDPYDRADEINDGYEVVFKLADTRRLILEMDKLGFARSEDGLEAGFIYWRPKDETVEGGGVGFDGWDDVEAFIRDVHTLQEKYPLGELIAREDGDFSKIEYSDVDDFNLRVAIDNYPVMENEQEQRLLETYKNEVRNQLPEEERTTYWDRETGTVMVKGEESIAREERAEDSMRADDINNIPRITEEMNRLGYSLAADNVTENGRFVIWMNEDSENTGFKGEILRFNGWGETESFIRNVRELQEKHPLGKLINNIDFDMADPTYHQGQYGEVYDIALRTAIDTYPSDRTEEEWDYEKQVTDVYKMEVLLRHAEEHRMTHWNAEKGKVVAKHDEKYIDFVTHNLEAARAERWNDWKGEAGVEESVIEKYEQYLTLSEAPTRDFIDARQFCMEYNNWMSDNAQYPKTEDGIMDEIIKDTVDVLNGDFANMRDYIEDYRLNYEDVLSEDETRDLNHFEEKLSEFESRFADRGDVKMEQNAVNTDKIKVAIESTDDFSEESFHTNMLNTAGRGKEDYYRLVSIGEDGLLHAVDEQIFRSAQDALASVDTGKYEVVNYDTLVNEAFRTRNRAVNERALQDAHGEDGKLYFEYVDVSDTNTGWGDNAGKDYGHVDGLVRGFNIEFKHKETGEITYNSCVWEYGNIEDYYQRQIDEWGDIGFVLFEAERSKGYEPTGRAVFRGYGRDVYDPDVRDTVVEKVDIEEYLKENKLVPSKEIDRHASILENTSKELSRSEKLFHDIMQRKAERALNEMTEAEIYANNFSMDINARQSDFEHQRDFGHTWGNGIGEEQEDPEAELQRMIEANEKEYDEFLPLIEKALDANVPESRIRGVLHFDPSGSFYFGKDKMLESLQKSIGRAGLEDKWSVIEGGSVNLRDNNGTWIYLYEKYEKQYFDKNGYTYDIYWGSVSGGNHVILNPENTNNYLVSHAFSKMYISMDAELAEMDNFAWETVSQNPERADNVSLELIAKFRLEELEKEIGARENGSVENGLNEKLSSYTTEQLNAALSLGRKEYEDYLSRRAENMKLSNIKENIKVEGHKGTWSVIDEAAFDGKTLYLLEHEDYGDEAACLIVDEDRNIVMEDVWNGFDDYREQAGQEQSASLEEEQSEVRVGDFMVFKDFGEYKATHIDNYMAQIRNAQSVVKIEDVASMDEAVETVKKMLVVRGNHYHDAALDLDGTADELFVQARNGYIENSDALAMVQQILTNENKLEQAKYVGVLKEIADEPEEQDFSLGRMKLNVLDKQHGLVDDVAVGGAGSIRMYAIWENGQVFVSLDEDAGNRQRSGANSIDEETFLSMSREDFDRFINETYAYGMIDMEDVEKAVVEKVEEEMHVMIDGNYCIKIDEWQNGEENHVIGELTDSDGVWYFAKVTDNSEQFKGEYTYEFGDKKPSRSAVESMHIDRVAQIETDRIEAERGADGRRAFPNLNAPSPKEVIAEFTDALRDVCTTHSLNSVTKQGVPLYVHEDGTWHDLIADVAEKLKGEKSEFAEVREKTIDEFANALRDVCETHSTGHDEEQEILLYVHEDGTWHDLVMDVTEKMLGEKERDNVVEKYALPEETKELSEQEIKDTALYQGLVKTMESDGFKAYCDTMNKLMYRNYSAQNCGRIVMQFVDRYCNEQGVDVSKLTPEQMSEKILEALKSEKMPTYLMGYDGWKEYGRQVTGKGVAYTILAPNYIYERGGKGSLLRTIKSEIKKQLDSDKTKEYAEYRLGKTGLGFIGYRNNGLMDITMNGKTVRGKLTEEVVRKFLDSEVIGKLPNGYSPTLVYDVQNTIQPEFLWVKNGKFTKDELVLDEKGEPQTRKAYKNSNILEYKIRNSEARIEKFAPEFSQEIKELDEEKMGRLFEVLQKVSADKGIPMTVEAIEEEGTKGFYHQIEKRIAIKDTLSNTEKCAVAFHEMAHADMHAGKTDMNRNLKEVQAEAVAFMTAQNFGIETDTATFNYLASWSKGRELSELQSSMNDILKQSKKLFKEISAELEKQGYDLNLERESEKGLEEEPNLAVMDEYIAMSETRDDALEQAYNDIADDEPEQEVQPKEPEQKAPEEKPVLDPSIAEFVKSYKEYVLLESGAMTELKEDAKGILKNTADERGANIIKEQINICNTIMRKVNDVDKTLNELENPALSKEEAEKAKEKVEKTYRGISELKLSFSDLSDEFTERMKEVKALENASLKDRYNAEPIETMKAYIKEAKDERLNSLTDMEISYIAKSDYISSEFGKLIKTDMKDFMAAAVVQVENVRQIKANNGAFVEVSWCEQWSDKAIFEKGTVAHPKTANAVIEQAETDIRSLKADAKDTDSYYPYSKCKLALFTENEGKLTANITRVDIGDGTQKNLSDHLKQCCRDTNALDAYKTACKERVQDRAIAPAKVAEMDAKSATEAKNTMTMGSLKKSVEEKQGSNEHEGQSPQRGKSKERVKDRDRR